MFYQEIKFGTAFVLEEALSSQILGYVCGIQVLDEFSLTNISVKKDYQNRGFGFQLLEYVLARLIADSCKYCYLEVRVSNTKAVSLYEKFGFEKIGIRKGYYSNPIEDAYLMRLELTNTIKRRVK